MCRHQSAAGLRIMHHGAQQDAESEPGQGVIAAQQPHQHAVRDMRHQVHDRHHEEQVEHRAADVVQDRGDAGQLQHPLQRPGQREIRAGQNPVRGALVDVEARDPARQSRDDLGAAGAGADDRHPLVPRVVPVVPAVGAQDLTGEIAQPFEVGCPGVDVAAHRADDEPRRHRRPVTDRQLPHRVLGIPPLSDHVMVWAQQRIQTEAAGGVGEVAVDLRTRRENPAPPRVSVERELVPQDRDVDREARVVVVTPGAAEIVAALQNRDIGDSAPAELVRGRDTAGTRADDRDVVFGTNVPGHRHGGPLRPSVIPKP